MLTLTFRDLDKIEKGSSMKYRFKTARALFNAQRNAYKYGDMHEDVKITTSMDKERKTLTVTKH